MTVIDVRNIFSDRDIHLIDVNASHIYYTEEKEEDGHNRLFILEYNRTTRKEKIITNYTLEDPAFRDHVYVFEKNIILMLENGSNSFWLIEIDRKSGAELNRRKVVCTGAFKECMALDSQHVLIYMAEDEANAQVFEKYKEVTGCEFLCYLYNVKTNQKSLVKVPLIARLGCDNIKHMQFKYEDYLVLLDPYAEESIKEKYFKEQRWIHDDIRDNIWLCRAEDLEREIEAGEETITKKCIASADIKALVRYMGTDGSKVFFRAKEFRSGLEKICSYDISANTLSVEATIEQPPEGTFYFVEEKPFKVFTITPDKEKTSVTGEVNSEASLSFPSKIGSFISCIESRYVVTRAESTSENGESVLTYYIFDPMMDSFEGYACRCHFKGNTLVFY